MNDIVRKLASIRRIAEIKPIEGADKIVAYRVDGWWVVSQKDAFNVGDLVLYFEIDSFLNVRPEFEFLRKNSFKSTKNLGDGFRIKTIKLKGQISQGLILPITDFQEFLQTNQDGQKLIEFLNEGDNVTEILGIQKYEKPIPSCLQGTVKGNFPSFIRKTDQERYQNLSEKEKNCYKNIPFEVTVKMDGSSMTVYYKDGDFGVCSRNLDLKDDTENLYWKIAKELKLKEKLEKLQYNIALQMELCGPGIQGNPQKLDTHKVFIFDIYDINCQRYFSPYERYIILEKLNLLFNIVPILGINYFGENIFDHEKIHMIADNTRYNNIPAEGVVFKSMRGRYSFKMISNVYLLKEKD
jgi:RNA ligase (TIGR02306 family)